MIQIVVDQTLREKLGNLLQPVELCDESGTIIPRIDPVVSPEQYDGLEPMNSSEELQQRR